MKSNTGSIRSSCTALLLLWSSLGLAEEVLPFGMSTALTGPAAELGLNVRAGVEAAFDEQNSVGGLDGRRLELIVLDDGYEPDRTGPNMRALIHEHQVLGIIGNVGTPTAVVATPIANRERVLFFGAYSGAGVLRKNPPDRYVINYRASYAEETARMVDVLIKKAGLKPEEIAFFTQRDAYGDAGYFGGLAALKEHGLVNESEVAHGRYERNTLTVENGLADILAADPPVRAVIMVGAYEPSARFIKLAKEFQLDALFLNVSFVGAKPLCQALGDMGEGVIITQVVPHIDSEVPIVKNYQAALASGNTHVEPSFGGLEGYIAGRILILALEKIDGPISREAIVDSLENLSSFDIGLGQPLDLFPQDHQACSQVWFTIIQNGRVEACSPQSLPLAGRHD